jgi:hypothetical protein
MLVLLFAAGFARAQEGDPLKSPACGAALASLQAARADKAAPEHIEHLRSEAASICLGTAHPARNTARTWQGPISVPPPQIDVPVARPGLPAPVAPTPPVAIDRPSTPANCDPGGCWTNNGSHLQLLPPNLMGPRGLCTQQGGQVYCP